MKTTDGKFQELLNVLPRTQVFRSLIPLGALPGWPWPRRSSDGRLAVSVPFYASPAQPKTPRPIYPPLATLTLLWANGTPVEYRDLRFDCPWPEGDWQSPCDQFPHTAVAEYSSQRWYAELNDAYEAYNQLFAALEAHVKFDGEAKERLIAHLRRLTPPGLQPFYLRLSPAFFAPFFGTP